MDLEVSVPLDDDGFLRRECPACSRQFKWLPSDDREPTADGRDGCPYCRGRYDPSEFMTEAQSSAALEVVGEWVTGQLERAGFRAESNGRTDAPMSEPNDMRLVHLDCHPSEPVKVYDAWVDADQPVHCIVCGATHG